MGRRHVPDVRSGSWRHGFWNRQDQDTQKTFFDLPPDKRARFVPVVDVYRARRGETMLKLYRASDFPSAGPTPIEFDIEIARLEVS